MSDRPTPETDALAKAWQDWDSSSNDEMPQTYRELSRELERQRDEAREQLNRICRDGFGYQDTISLETCADYVLRKLKEERELARELRDALTGMEEYYRQHVIQGSLFLQVHAALTKAKEVLP